MNKPTVLITTAGSNSRFFPLNSDSHKSAIKLHGQQLIERTLANLEKYNFRQVIIMVGERDFNGQGLSASLQPSDFPGLDIVFQLQPQPKGMGDAVLLAAPQLGEQFAVVFPSLTNAGELLSQMCEMSEPEVICVTPTLEPWLFGIVTLENDRAVALVEKPPQGQEPSHYKIEGAYLLSREFIDILRQEGEAEYNFEAALDALMHRHSLPVLALDHELPTLKFAWHLFNHQAAFFAEQTAHRARSAQIDDTAIIDESQGPVFIGENVVIGHAAKIVGPAYIGDDSLVGDFAFVRQSSLESHVQVGANTEVVRSIIMSHTTIHYGYLADSILGENVKIGAGLITANRRLDRESVSVVVKNQTVRSGRSGLGVIVGHGANLGIRVSTMPGVLIGSKATIFPGQILYTNVDHLAVVK